MPGVTPFPSYDKENAPDCRISLREVKPLPAEDHCCNVILGENYRSSSACTDNPSSKTEQWVQVALKVYNFSNSKHMAPSLDSRVLETPMEESSLHNQCPQSRHTQSGRAKCGRGCLPLQHHCHVAPSLGSSRPGSEETLLIWVCWQRPLASELIIPMVSPSQHEAMQHFRSKV